MTSNNDDADQRQRAIRLARDNLDKEEKIVQHEATIARQKDTIGEQGLTILSHEGKISKLEKTTKASEDEIAKLKQEMAELRESKMVVVRLPLATTMPTPAISECGAEDVPTPLKQSAERGLKRERSGEDSVDIKDDEKPAPKLPRLSPTPPRLVHIGPSVPPMQFILGPKDPEKGKMPFWRIENLPCSLEKLRNTIIDQFKEWNERSAAAVAEYTSWHDSFTSCMDAYVTNQGQAGLRAWTLEHPRKYACKTCADKQKACIIRFNGTFSVLPLPPGARIPATKGDTMGAEPMSEITGMKDEVGRHHANYWLAPMENVSQKEGGLKIWH